MRTMETTQPVIFLSHGAGPSYYMSKSDNPIFAGLDKDSKAADFLRNLKSNAKLKLPRAVLVLSAHWEEPVCTVNTATNPSLYYDYGGFPQEMYKLQWPVPGAPEIARKVKDLLQSKGIRCNENNKRGLDHGVFVPLKLVFPEANIPVQRILTVFQVSLLKNLKMSDHLAIGEALTDLTKEGILIIGSGFATHNGGRPGNQVPDWALQFRKWLHDVFTNPNYTADERKNKLLSYSSEPSFSLAHMPCEHFLPLAMTCATAGYVAGKILYSEFVMQSLLNEHYIFPVS
ncbi:hypothetical protein KUTeg_004183 [Tegillarca granosa]|uniref:Extradiol ring-cleavage dioxygenase class III enzyme subunit B domain-containing protein n=1 Tax=Tegillarca granosa TaxID=220873 RepID=A0ABQ9FSZ7_TEGGR|nr:hypothetical protein KUTeg_004183 [Tegillarca granosa]